MNSFKFSNLNEIVEGIGHKANRHKIKIIELDVNERYINIKANKWIASTKDVIEFFRDVMTTVECAQNIFKPMYVTNHICEEYYLDIENNEIEINIICNKRFDVNDYYK